MQRQSIGGSPTRVHAAAGEVVPEEVKPEKPTRPSYAPATMERSVHLIPLLTLLCLLVLYLSSHDPSVTTPDVAGNGIVDSGSSRFIHGTLMAEGGVAMVNHRGLKADAKKPHLLHIRKLGSDKPQASAGET